MQVENYIPKIYKTIENTNRNRKRTYTDRNVYVLNYGAGNQLYRCLYTRPL